MKVMVMVIVQGGSGTNSLSPNTVRFWMTDEMSNLPYRLARARSLAADDLDVEGPCLLWHGMACMAVGRK